MVLLVFVDVDIVIIIVVVVVVVIIIIEAALTCNSSHCNSYCDIVTCIYFWFSHTKTIFFVLLTAAAPSEY